MMHGLAFPAFTTARRLTFVVLFAALRCAVGWRGGFTRLRSLPVSPAARSHHPSREPRATFSRHSCLPLQSAIGRSSLTSRRRRGRLRDGGGGGGPWIHDWSLSLPNSPANSPTFSSNCDVAATTRIGASTSSESVKGNGAVFVLARGQGEGHPQPSPRRNRRQRRRQRLRLRPFREVGVGVAEEEEKEEEEATSGIESNVVEAGGLDIDAVPGSSITAGAGAAGSVVSEVPGAEAASGGLGSAPGSPSVASVVGGWRLQKGVAHGSPPVPPRATQEPGRQGRSTSPVVDSLRTEDDRFMHMALRLAERARMEGEVPIGAVLTETVASGGDGKRRVLSTGRNHVERRRDASAHAEMLCLQAAAKARRNWRLAGTTLYVTMEPCAMCLSAAQLFRVDRVVFGAPNPNLGACGGWVDLSAQKHAFHDLEVTGGVLAEECATPLRRFFRSRRREGEAAAAAGHRPAAGGVAVGEAPRATR